MAYAIAAYLHFLAIFLLFALLLLEHQLFRQPLTLERARSLFRIDIAFGITAAAVLASGIARAVFYGKGLDYYLKNSFFHAKVGLFVVVAVLSIYPTLTFLRWRPARGRPGTDHLERQRQMGQADHPPGAAAARDDSPAGGADGTGLRRRARLTPGTHQGVR